MGKRILIFCVCVLTLSACVTANDWAMQYGAPPETAVKLRLLQSRRFETLDEKQVMDASTQTLQDLGFTISESTLDVGVLTASKQRDAVETGQVVGAVIIALVAALGKSSHQPTWDKEQTIHVAIVSTPILSSRQTEVRVAFDRILTNNQGIQWRAELIMDEKIYQEFFEKLSQALFLEAQSI